MEHCPLCNIDFGSPRDLVQHCLDKHPDEASIKIDVFDPDRLQEELKALGDYFQSRDLSPPIAYIVCSTFNGLFTDKNLGGKKREIDAVMAAEAQRRTNATNK